MVVGKSREPHDDGDIREGGLGSSGIFRPAETEVVGYFLRRLGMIVKLCLYVGLCGLVKTKELRLLRTTVSRERARSDQT